MAAICSPVLAPHSYLDTRLCKFATTTTTLTGQRCSSQRRLVTTNKSLLIRRSKQKPQICQASDTHSNSTLVATVPNPQTVEDVIEQAQNAVENALASGITRQSLQILLPVDQRQFNYLDTEPRDYPCSIKDEFTAACRVTQSILKKFGSEGNNEVQVKRIGEFENEMDPVAALYSSDNSIAAVVFPIAETLKQIKSLMSKDEKRATLIVNPQWRASGQVISDFGFGPWKRQAEEFVNSFQPTYMLLEQRIGEASNVISGSGGVVRLLKCYPGDWHVYLMSWDGTSHLIGLQATQPSYKELEELVTEARKNIPWTAAPRMLGGSEPAPPPLPKSLSEGLTDDKIDAMEKTELRRALLALNLPSSGKLETLRERLKEAQSNNTTD